MAENDIIAGLDLGTTKVCAIVAEQTDEGLDIIGIGSVSARGLKKGVVVNVESTVQAIRAAVEQAETMAGCRINTAYAGIAGSHIRGMNQEGIAAISHREVTQTDVDRVLEQAKAIPLPSDRQVIHVLPQEYIVDAQDGIREPIGMSGVRLQARVHLVTAAAASVQNVIKCAERCGLYVPEVVLEPLASAEAVLSEDEKEIGAVLIDVGGGTTDVIIYVDGAAVHTTVIPMGGINLTNDVATGLRTPLAEAERIKVKYGCAAADLVDADENIEVPSVGGRSPRVIPRRLLSDIVEPRVEEIFSTVKHIIGETGLGDLLASGAIITGGTTLLDGMVEQAEKVLELPVRRAVPLGVGGLVDVVKSPAYSTAVGLVKYGAARLTEQTAAHEELVAAAPGWKFGSKVSRWFKEVF